MIIRSVLVLIVIILAACGTSAEATPEEEEMFLTVTRMTMGDGNELFDDEQLLDFGYEACSVLDQTQPESKGELKRSIQEATQGMEPEVRGGMWLIFTTARGSLCPEWGQLD